MAQFQERPLIQRVRTARPHPVGLCQWKTQEVATRGEERQSSDFSSFPEWSGSSPKEEGAGNLPPSFQEAALLSKKLISRATGPGRAQPWEAPGSSGRDCAVKSWHGSVQAGTAGQTLMLGLQSCEKQVLASAQLTTHFTREVDCWTLSTVQGPHISVLFKRPRIPQSHTPPRFLWCTADHGRTGLRASWAWLCQGAQGERTERPMRDPCMGEES